MTVNDTDKFLVNRSGSSYHLEAQNLMAELQDDDLMLVNRSGKSYKATGAEIKGSLKPPAEVIKPQIIAPANGAGQTLSPETDLIVTVDDAVKASTYDVRGDKETRDWLSAAVKTFIQADAIDTNIAVGSAPGAGGENSWLYFDLKVESAMTFGRTSDDDADCQGIVYGSNDGENWVL